jgi:sugar lactone lactonase YvrE
LAIPTIVAASTKNYKSLVERDTRATDLVAKAPVTLNEVDPDSMTVDLAGELVLIDQGGSEIVTIGNPGTAQQQVSRIPVGTQLDDTVWAPASAGSLYVTDASQNRTYVVSGTFTAGTVFTEAPNDSGVSSFLATVDLTTGFITPFAVGFGKPTGMVWSPGP